MAHLLSLNFAREVLPIALYPRKLFIVFPLLLFNFLNRRSRNPVPFITKLWVLDDEKGVKLVISLYILLLERISILTFALREDSYH